MDNEVLRNIKTRRSCRAYTAQQVEPEKLKAILEAGTWAATGMGRQAPKIVVLTDPEEIAELERMNAEVLGTPDAHPFYGAPAVCVVLTDPEVNTCVEDGSLVMGNLMLAAHSLGVASCWIHRARQEFDSPAGKALLKKWGVDERYIGVGHCILGYAAKEPPAPKPRKSDYVIYR